MSYSCSPPPLSLHAPRNRVSHALLARGKVRLQELQYKATKILPLFGLARSPISPSKNIAGNSQKVSTTVNSFHCELFQ